jgi:hypothetical protein
VPWSPPEPGAAGAPGASRGTVVEESSSTSRDHAGTLTGAEVKAFLENGVSRIPAADGRFPQVSGLCFRYDITAPAGGRVSSIMGRAADGSCTGPAVVGDGSYTLATNASWRQAATATGDHLAATASHRSSSPSRPSEREGEGGAYDRRSPRDAGRSGSAWRCV